MRSRTCQIATLLTTAALLRPRMVSLATFASLLLAACQDTEAPTPDRPAGNRAEALHSQKSSRPACSGAFRTLDVPGSTETFARGLNDPGDVTGLFDDADGVVHGFVRDRHGSFQIITVPGSILTTTTNITNTGVIAGSYLDERGGFHGYVNTGDDFQTIDYPGAVDTRVRGIDRGGELLGNFGSVAEEVEHGFIKDANGFRQVDVPGSLSTDVWGGDGRGRYVGDWTSEDGNVHGFLLENGNFTTLDVPGPYWATAARAITSSGTIVGEVEEAGTFLDHGFITTEDGYELIDYPGAIGTFAERINNRGEVVGIYTDAEGRTHGFTLTGCGTGS